MSFPIGETRLVAQPRTRGRTHDIWLLVSAGLLILIGLGAIYSVDSINFGGHYTVRQIAYAGVGLLVFAIANRVSLNWIKGAATPLYIVNLVMLMAVFVIGKSRGEAQRWIDFGPLQFQPSDITKVLLTLTLAAYYANRSEDMKEFKTFFGGILHMLPPFVLVFMQPHLGGAIALLVIWAVVSIYAGVPWKYLLATAAAVAGLAAFAWFTPGILSDYQHKRVRDFLNPDPLAGGYQANQSVIAIGSGGVLGEGFLKGDQKAARYIPDQHTDFVFSVIGEEGGFVGSMLTLSAFGFFFYRVWLVGFRTTTPMARMVVGGLFGVLAFHTIVNLGMVLQLTPVVGLWLPFVSAGGTALWMCMAAVGILDNIK